MANQKSFSPEDIIQSQQEFINNWFKTAQGSFGNSAAQTMPPFFSNPFQSMWQNNPANDMQDFMSRFTKAGQDYFNMAEGMTSFMPGANSLQQMSEGWIKQMTYGLNKIMEQPVPTLDDLYDKHVAFWDMPQDMFGRTLSTLFPFPGDFFKAFSPEGRPRMPGDIHGHLDQFLATPSIGYTRESQDQYKDLARLMLAYQQAMHEYNAAMSKVGLNALSLLQERLTENYAAQQKSPESFKEIYALWTEVAEEVYGEYVMTEEYTELYGKLINAMMAVKKQTAKMTDEIFEAYNLPTRKEVNTLNERLQETRRQHAKDIAALQETIDELARSRGTKTAKKVAAKKTASKKKPATKNKAVAKKTVKKATKKAAAKKTSKKPVKKATKKVTKKTTAKRRGR